MRQHKYIVLLLVFIIIVLGVVYLYKNHFKEGFSVYSEGDRFTKSQETKFWSNHNKVLSINSGLDEDIKKASSAFVTTDTLNNTKNAKTDISFYFEKDFLPGAAEKNLQCSSVLEPRLLPSHDETASSGCGWWYLDSDQKVSVGAKGTHLGPFDTSTLGTGGKWVWDLNAAQKMEDVKRCRKIKSCDIADLVPGRCGFCPSLMSGVPVRADGTSLYENDPALNCENLAITNPSKCPRPAPPGASPDDPQPTGPMPPALCDPNPATGKLSNDCLISLAKGAGCTDSSVIINILSGDNKGYYGQPGTEHQRFSIAIQTIKTDTSLASPDVYFGFGSCTRAEALGYYSSIVRTVSSAPTEKARNAASFLAYGTEFDECTGKDDETGPFTLHCLQKVAREAGCQPDGTDFPIEIIQKISPNVPKACGRFGNPSADGYIRLYNKKECDSLGGNFYPNGECIKREGGSFSWECRELNKVTNSSQSTKDKYDLMTWAGVMQYFKKLYDDMHSSDPITVIKATKSCLGITITEPEADCGDIMGVSYYVYKWDYDYNTSGGGIPNSVYYGRVSSSKMIEISNNGVYTPFNIGTDRIFMRVKGQLKNTQTALTTKIWTQTDDGIAVRINGKSLLQKFWDQGPTAYETPAFTLGERKDTPFEIDWYNNYGGYVFVSRLWLNNQYIQIPETMLRQSQPSGYPIARWDFYEGIMEDRCRTLNTQMIGAVPFSSIDGKKCMIFTGQNYLQITNGIAATGFKSISMMVYLQQPPQGYPRLWEFNNTPFGGSWCQDAIFGCASPNNGLGVSFYCVQNCNGPQAWSGAGTVEVGKWYHMVWTIDDSNTIMEFFINGNKVITTKESGGILRNKIYKNLYIMNSVERFNKNMAVAWFRIYDYRLTVADIKTDRLNGFSKNFPVSRDSGWA